MKTALSLALLFLSTSALGAVKFALEMDYGGRKLSPSILVKSGEAATITQDDLKVELKAEDKDPNRVEVFFKVFQTSTAGDILLATPAISTAWGTTAEITQKMDGSGEILRLKVKPTLIP